MTTLVIFARAPEPGRVKTRLVPAVGAAAAARLHAAFVDDTCAMSRGLADRRVLAVAGDGDDRFLRALADREGIAAVAQADGDLGDRMHAALAAALAAGADAALVIGTDAPALPRRLLARAVDELARAEVVLGPAADGGYWTIGLRAPRPELFRGVAWGTPSVLAETRARLAALALPHVLLDEHWDVDTPADLARLAASLAADPDPRLAPATRAALGALMLMSPL